MKKTTIVFSLVFSSLAYAGMPAFQCKEVDTGPDNGYKVTVSKSEKHALVETVTIAGTETLAKLSCVKKMGRPSHPDAITTILSCREPNLVDGGYALEVKQGGVAGLTSATLSKVTFAGTEAVAEMYCSTFMN